jgi:hypothetical protein
MSHKSRGLKVLSLAFLAIAGLMAFMATGAQASEKSWLVEGVDIAGSQKVLVGIHSLSALVVTALKLEIDCLTIESNDLLILPGTAVEVHGELLFSNCHVSQNGAPSAACTKHLNGAKVEGLLEPIVAKGKGRIVLTGGKNELLLEPSVAGGNFAQIKFDPSCALPETNNVKGKLLAECLKASNLEAVDCKQEEKVHLLKQGSEAEDSLTFGTNLAKLTGIAKAQLESERTWCGHV